jgi:5-formyltetrahydrofolate cyclo-ligase
MPEFLSAGTVFCFVGTAGEIDTRPILTAALRAGQTLCVPLCTGNGLMELRRIDSLEQLSPGFHGIPEPPPAAGAINPDDVDFTVIPCAACDRVGHRLGKGGGYYDRFLAAYRGPAVLVCRERLLWDEIPMEPHDAVVPWVVTERALYEDGVPARTE